MHSDLFQIVLNASYQNANPIECVLPRYEMDPCG